MQDHPAVEIEDVPSAARYEARVGGVVVGFVTYRASAGHLAVLHTEVDAAHAGQGIATRMVRFVLDDIRARGLMILPICPLFRAHLERHPEDADLVLGRPASS